MELKSIKVNLCGTTYKIDFIGKPIEEGNEIYWGMCYHESLEIKVATQTSKGVNRPLSEVYITLLHEIIHAILASGSYHKENDNEPMVEWLARSFYTILKQNKLCLKQH